MSCSYNSTYHIRTYHRGRVVQWKDGVETITNPGVAEDVLACEYCGSMHPDEFMRRVRYGEEVDPTDKDYKAYINSAPGVGKFYYEHLSEEQQEEFVQLLREKKIKIGFPGRFYVLPFFIQIKPPDAAA